MKFWITHLYKIFMHITQTVRSTSQNQAKKETHFQSAFASKNYLGGLIAASEPEGKFSVISLSVKLSI